MTEAGMELDDVRPWRALRAWVPAGMLLWITLAAAL